MSRKKETIEEMLFYRFPMKIRKISVGVNNVAYPVCPRCDSNIEREYMKHCVECGQKLNWNGYYKAEIVHDKPVIDIDQ